MKKYSVIIFILLVLFFSTAESKAANKIMEGTGINLIPSLVTSENLNYVKDLNLKYVRTGIPWSRVEYKKNECDWSEYDTLIKTIEDFNLKPMIIIGFNNPLYGADEVFSGVSNEDQRKGFTKFALNLIARYKGRKIVWEIWNEPNIGEFWKPSPNAFDYALMAKSVLQKTRYGFPDEIIIAPALAKPNSGMFLDVCEKAGIYDYIDGISLHFYKSDGNTVVIPEWLNISRINKEVTDRISSARADKQAIPMVVSELGYSTAWQQISEDDQGIFLQRELIINKANNIPISIIHTLFDLDYNLNSDESKFGLIKKDLSLKSSYEMVKRAAKELNGAKFIKRYVTSDPNDFIFEFSRNNNTIIFAWTIGKPHKANIYGTTVELLDTVKMLDFSTASLH